MHHARHGVALLFLLILLFATVGLAVPRIKVGVQPAGSGGCEVRSPVKWATVTLNWRKNPLTFTWTLRGASVVFSSAVDGPVSFTLLMTIEGYPSVSIVRGTLSLKSGIVAGRSYRLVLNDTPSYLVAPPLFPEPEVLNATGLIEGGASSCSGRLSILVGGVGFGSTSYSPPPLNVSEIKVAVNNTGNPELRNYVINFSLSPSCVPDLSRVYVTDSSGKQLYFWAFNDSTGGRIWFWVNYTVPANSIGNVVVHFNGTAPSPYLNPRRVFWYFTDRPVTLEGSLLNPATYSIPYNVYGILNSGYPGYSVDTYASLGHAGLGLPLLGPYWVALTNGGYYGLGIADDGSVYIVSGPAPSQVSLGGNALGEVPSWGPGLYSVSLHSSGRRISAEMFYEGAAFASRTFRGALRLRFTPHFVLGQGSMFGLSNGSVYYWIGFRPLARVPPRVTVPPSCGAPPGGAYTFTLYFRP